ncbi:MAG: class I SAM-dependent methyltransferase [Candidatus Moraniibacteriota bacterium]
MDQKTFDNFFQPYAKNVDKADDVSAFWRLSDALIMEIIKESIGKHCSEQSAVCDAGGGTGRWVVKMSIEIPGKFMVYDRSVDMLAKAKENIEKAGLSDKVTLVQGDLTDMKSIESESIDHIVSIYSPISFISENGKAASEMYRVLKKGGRILLMGHSYYNALASKVNNYRADSEELARLSEEYRVKWAPYVPELVTFSKESMESLLKTAGFRIEKTYGVPVFVQPGPEDFDPENEKVSAVSTYLENPDVFKQIFDLEMEHNSRDTVANRGMNIFTLATKI